MALAFWILQKNHLNIVKKEIVQYHLAVFYLNFHGTSLNAHFEKIQTTNTHNSFIMTEFFTCLKHDFTHVGWVDGWLSRTLFNLLIFWIMFSISRTCWTMKHIYWTWTSLLWGIWFCLYHSSGDMMVMGDCVEYDLMFLGATFLWSCGNIVKLP